MEDQNAATEWLPGDVVRLDDGSVALREQVMWEVVSIPQGGLGRTGDAYIDDRSPVLIARAGQPVAAAVRAETSDQPAWVRELGIDMNDPEMRAYLVAAQERYAPEFAAEVADKIATARLVALTEAADAIAEIENALLPMSGYWNGYKEALRQCAIILRSRAVRGLAAKETK